MTATKTRPPVAVPTGAGDRKDRADALEDYLRGQLGGLLPLTVSVYTQLRAAGWARGDIEDTVDSMVADGRITIRLARDAVDPHVLLVLTQEGKP